MRSACFFSLSHLCPVSDPVPGLVCAEHWHLRQDEQAGEQEGHLPGHGAVPCQVSQGRNPEHTG